MGVQKSIRSKNCKASSHVFLLPNVHVVKQELETVRFGSVLGLRFHTMQYPESDTLDVRASEMHVVGTHGEKNLQP